MALAWVYRRRKPGFSPEHEHFCALQVNIYHYYHHHYDHHHSLHHSHHLFYQSDYPSSSDALAAWRKGTQSSRGIQRDTYRCYRLQCRFRDFDCRSAIRLKFNGSLLKNSAVSLYERSYSGNEYDRVKREGVGLGYSRGLRLESSFTQQTYSHWTRNRELQLGYSTSGNNLHLEPPDPPPPPILPTYSLSSQSLCTWDRTV